MNGYWVLMIGGPTQSPNFFNIFQIRRSDTGDQVKPLSIQLSRAWSSIFLTQVVSTDTGGRVRLLPKFNFLMPSLLLTRAMSGCCYTPFSYFFHGTDTGRVNWHRRPCQAVGFSLKIFLSLILRYGPSFWYDFLINVSASVLSRHSANLK